MNADEIDRVMERLKNHVETLRGSVAPDVLAPIDAAFRKWDNFYYGPDFMQWPVNEVAAWTQRLPQLRQEIAMANQSGQPSVTTVQTATGGKIHQFDPIQIQGQVPQPIPQWVKLAGGGLIALVLWNLFKK